MKNYIHSLIKIRRSSRSITANIVEGWAKRHYENIFKCQLLDSIGSCDETKQWLDFALACQYITEDEHVHLTQRYNELDRMLHSLYVNWKSTVMPLSLLHLASCI